MSESGSKPGRRHAGGRRRPAIAWAVVGLASSAGMMLALAGCGPVPVFNGGEMAIDIGGADGGDLPAQRAILVTFYCGFGGMEEPKFLDAHVVSASGQRIRYPTGLHIGVYTPGKFALQLQLVANIDEWGFIAFARGYWPAVGIRGQYGERRTLLTRRPFLGEEIGGGPVRIPRGARAAARIVFYPRSGPWGMDVTANLCATDDLGVGYHLARIVEQMGPLVKVVDASESLTAAERLMIYRQLLEVVRRAAPMALRWDTPEYDSARQLLRERVVVLCRAVGEKPPPAAGDAAAWLKLVKADVGAKGIKAAAFEWMGPSVDAGWVKCVAYLLAQGADPDDCWGADFPTPLEVAARRGNLAAAKVLVSGGANVDHRIGAGEYGQRSALHTAVECGQRDMARFLLDSGAEVDARSDLGTPLHLAASGKDPHMVKLLLDRGADVHARGGEYSQDTPLHAACGPRPGSGDDRTISPEWKEMVEVLLSRGADPNTAGDAGRTPLHVALDWKLYDLVPLLLKHGADVNRKDARGVTPLRMARRWGTPRRIAKMLREHAAKGTKGREAS